MSVSSKNKKFFKIFRLIRFSVSVNPIIGFRFFVIREIFPRVGIILEMMSFEKFFKNFLQSAPVFIGMTLRLGVGVRF